MRRGQVMRVVPRENEDVNEIWIVRSRPLQLRGTVRRRPPGVPPGQGERPVAGADWDDALRRPPTDCGRSPENTAPSSSACWSRPSATLEETVSGRRRSRGAWGSNNIDHRLRQGDFSDQDNAPLYPGLGQSLQELESIAAVLLIGANPRKEQPLLAHRLRKAALAGARVMFVNPDRLRFPPAGAREGHRAAVRHGGRAGGRCRLFPECRRRRAGGGAPPDRRGPPGRRPAAPWREALRGERPPHGPAGQYGHGASGSTRCSRRWPR